MKKFLALTLTLILSLALTACGDRDDTPPPVQNPTPPQQEQTSQPQQGQPSAGQTTPNQTARAQTTDLNVQMNGTQEIVPATLYAGTGYSLYIPTEGWRQEQDLDDGISSVSWENLMQDDVKLEIFSLGQRDLTQAQAWVLAEEDDYRLTEGTDGIFTGMDPEDREKMEVRFCPSGTEMFVIITQYPEAAAGLGAQLDAMADTFELAQ